MEKNVEKAIVTYCKVLSHLFGHEGINLPLCVSTMP